MILLTMSDKELSRIDVIKEVLDKQLKQQDAASILGVGARILLIKSLLSIQPPAAP